MNRPLIGLCSALLLSAPAARGGTDLSVRIDNWTSHPAVKEVRTIYDEIQKGIKDKKYKTKVRRFNVQSSLCSTYPVKTELLAVDSEGKPRLYQVEQIGSHRELFTVERYYDAKGVLRFVYADRLISNVRIYLNRDGQVFWAVEKSGDQFAAFDSNDDDWETKPNSASGARAAFQEPQLCPEIEK